jgi:septum formation protein
VSRPTLVLASGSPRRARALRTLGVEFTVDPPDVDETPLPGEAPADMVLRLAIAKAGAAHRGLVRLAVDTTVVLDGVIVGKPADPDEAVSSLLELAGRTHDVISGWALVSGDDAVAGTVTSQVTLRPIERSEAIAYVATGEPLDKAGSYAIQGFGSRFVTGLYGSVGNVKGFPAEDIVPSLVAAGIEVARPEASLVALRLRFRA